MEAWKCLSLGEICETGWPLAPNLFILFVEAMSCFHGLRLSLGVEESLLDAEYADTSLYVEDSEDTFKIVRVALDTFCLATSAKIN